jgi:glyoxylase-like metal-dependent hydrolase (beta-lactamase superfamily II)
MQMARVASIFLNCALSILALGQGREILADTAQTRERVVTRIAEGVYAIRHVDPIPGWAQGNTTVIIGARDVLVVDACQTEAAAEEDIALIKQWTPLPVRFLVNSHWHGDHWQGNQAYVKAFPGVTILAHGETAELMAQSWSYLRQVALKESQDLLERTGKALTTGKKRDGSPLGDTDRRALELQLAMGKAMVAQAEGFHPQLPTLTFSDGITVDLGGREVRVFHPGRGNTAGDMVAFLPKERILATGDLVVQPVPFTFDGYPFDWIRTLGRLAELEPVVIIPGHGDVLRDLTYLKRLRDLLQSVVAQVRVMVGQNHAIELKDVAKKVDLKAFKDQFIGPKSEDGPFFDYAMNELVTLAFHEAKAR